MAIKQVGHDRIFWQIARASELAIKHLNREFPELKQQEKNDMFNLDLQDTIKELLIKHGLAE